MTTEAVRWSMMNTAMPAAILPGEGGHGFLVVWIGGGVRSWWWGGSREGQLLGGRTAEAGSSPVIGGSPGADTGGGEG